MSKVRQAIKYERRLSDAQVRGHIDLTNVQVTSQRELLQQAIAYERKYTDGQFGQLNLIAQEHRIFHEREHLLYEDAIDKASSAITSQLRILETEFERMREDGHKYMSIDRFEREHSALIERMETALKAVADKVGAEERVTLRQAAQEELLIKIQQNNRWLVGILMTVAIFGATTLLHVFNVI